MKRWKPVRLWPFAAGVVIAVSSGCGQTVPVPTSYAKYTAKDGAFSCEYPTGWTMEQGARSDNTYSWVKFTQGPAMIKISADTTGSLMSDIQKPNRSSNNGEEDYAVASVHDMQKRSISEEYTNYKERQSRVYKSTGLGEGRQSDFGADGGFGTRLRGTRTTLLTNNRRVSIMCQCPLPQWKNLSKAFDHVIASVSNR